MVRRLLIVPGIFVFMLALGLAGGVAPVSASNSFNLADCATLVLPITGTCPGNTGETTLTFNPLSTTGSETPTTVTVTAHNAATPTTLMDLFIKGDGSGLDTIPPGEAGLGITGDPLGVNEVSSADYLAFDATAAIANGSTGSGALVILSSLQPPGETFLMCLEPNATTAPVPGCTGQQTGTGGVGTDEVTVPVPTFSAALPFIGVTAGAGDLLVFKSLNIETRSIIVPVPEPSALALFSTGLIGLLLAGRRKVA